MSINDVDSAKGCSNCGQPIPRKMSFCGGCGFRVCANCGNSVDRSAAYCGACGTAHVSGPMPTGGQHPSPAPLTGPTTTAAATGPVAFPEPTPAATSSDPVMATLAAYIPPPVTVTKSGMTSPIPADQRRRILKDAVHREVAAGARIANQDDFQAVLIVGNKPNHIAHGIATLLTLVWAIGWMVATARAGERRVSLDVDEFGNLRRAVMA